MATEWPVASSGGGGSYTSGSSSGSNNQQFGQQNTLETLEDVPPLVTSTAVEQDITGMFDKIFKSTFFKRKFLISLPSFSVLSRQVIFCWSQACRIQ